MPDSFISRLAASQHFTGGALCIGLDPDPSRIPAACLGSRSVSHAVEAFCADIIAATADLACAYKLNFAFFEALGDTGPAVLRAVRRRIPETSIAIADAKRGDIGNSAQFYARAVFDDLGFDACTVAPYMGRDAVEPFLAYPGRAAFVLARTSNPGGSEFQTLESDGEPLFVRVARRVADWAADAPGEAGLVVGATDVDAMLRLRHMAPDLPFLVPGVGAQGGDANAVMRAAGSGVLVNSSRGILYASDGPDFASEARRAATALHTHLRI